MIVLLTNRRKKTKWRGCDEVLAVSIMEITSI